MQWLSEGSREIGTRMLGRRLGLTIAGCLIWILRRMYGSGSKARSMGIVATK
jgi:hypothetical protein